MAGTADISKYDLQVLATDFAPDDRVATSVRAAMKDQENEIAQLDAEISRPGTRLDELRARRDAVRHYYNVLKAVIAPVRKLPEEILGHIFLYCMPTYTEISISEAPLLLLRVCRRWRRIAEGTPALWTKLGFEGDTRINLGPCDIISMWLTNSGALPIDVTLPSDSESHLWTETYDGQKAHGIKLLVENFHRFCNFSAKLDILLEQEICRQMPIHAPLLERVYLYWDGSDPTNEIPISHLKHCISAPKLKTLLLQHPPMRDLFMLHPPSIRSITLLGDESPEISLDFLTLYGNLFFLDINVDEGARPLTFDGESRMLLPSLEEMFFTFNSTGDIEPFLDAFEVPMLQQFGMSFSSESTLDEGAITALDSFLYRSPAIQRLFVSGLSDTAAFTLFFPRLRELRSLMLCYCQIHDTIVKALTPDPLLPLSSWALPHLSKIDVRSSDLSQDLFLKMIESRALMDPDGGKLGEVDCIRCIVLGHTLGKEKGSLFDGLYEISQRSGGLLDIN